MPNLKFISLAVLKLLASIAPKIKGSHHSHDPGHAPFRKLFSGVTSGLSLGACVPNLKFLAFALMEIIGI